MCIEKLWLWQSGDEDSDDEEESQAEEDDDHGGCILAHSMGTSRASCCSQHACHLSASSKLLLNVVPQHRNYTPYDCHLAVLFISSVLIFYRLNL